MKIEFLLKTALLSVIVLICVYYLAFTFTIDYINKVDSDDYMFYALKVVHITTGIICILYLLEKAKSWKNGGEERKRTKRKRSASKSEK